MNLNDIELQSGEVLPENLFLSQRETCFYTFCKKQCHNWNKPDRTNKTSLERFLLLNFLKSLKNVQSYLLNFYKFFLNIWTFLVFILM